MILITRQIRDNGANLLEVDFYYHQEKGNVRAEKIVVNGKTTNFANLTASTPETLLTEAYAQIQI